MSQDTTLLDEYHIHLHHLIKQTRQKTPNPIKLVVLDVDGCMTDGGLYYGAEGMALKRYNVLDGAGIKLLQKHHIHCAIVTGNPANGVHSRAKDLGIREDMLFFKVDNKSECIEQLLARLSLRWSEVAGIGDDWQDLAHLNKCGLSVAPKSAHPEVRRLTDITTQAKGGEGAVRELCDLVLMHNGVYESALTALASNASHRLSTT